MPLGIQEVQDKRYGRRYLHRTGELILREEELAQSPQLVDLLAQMKAERDQEPVSPPDPPPIDRGATDVEIAAQVGENRRLRRDYRARLALQKAELAVFRLPPGPPVDPALGPVTDDVPQAVERVREAAREAGKVWHCWPHTVLGSADGSGTWGPARPPRLDLRSGMDPPKGNAGKGVTVAIVDTGVFDRHAWLHGNLLGFDVEDSELVDQDEDGKVDLVAGHGTFIAGVVRKMAPGATIIVRGAMRTGGLVTDAELAGTIDELLALGTRIDILNLSVGAYTHGATDDALPATNAALWRLRQKYKTLTVVAAAGNDRRSEPFYPAARSDVIGVGALDAKGDPAEFSNFGPWVDTWALGVEVVSCWIGKELKKPNGAGKGDEMTEWSGTSFAAPMVAGAIAAARTS